MGERRGGGLAKSAKYGVCNFYALMFISFTESLKITEWLRLEGTFGGLVQPPLLKQGHLEVVPQGCVQIAFGYLQGGRLHSLSGQAVPVLGHPHSEKVFPNVQREPPVFWFVPIASGPDTGHHWKEPGSILYAPLLQVFDYMDENP